MKSLFVVGCSALLFSGCGQTYWAFPPGKNLATFQADERHCNLTWVGLMASCLAHRGYTQISAEQHAAMQQKAQQEIEAGLKPMDVAAYELGTNEIFIGKSEPFFEMKPDGSPNAKAVIKMEGVVSNVYCTGQGEIVSPTGTGRGSFGSATLLCKDGRVIKALFTYETPRSGFGSGTDGAGGEFRFIFGDLNVNPVELRKLFKQARSEKLPPAL